MDSKNILITILILVILILSYFLLRPGRAIIPLSPYIKIRQDSLIKENERLKESIQQKNDFNKILLHQNDSLFLLKAKIKKKTQDELSKVDNFFIYNSATAMQDIFAESNIK